MKKKSHLDVGFARLNVTRADLHAIVVSRRDANVTATGFGAEEPVPASQVVTARPSRFRSKEGG